MELVKNLYLRARLVKKSLFRFQKSLILKDCKSLIGEVKYEAPDEEKSAIPAILLSSFSHLEDFLVLSYLFRDKNLTFIAPRTLPDEKTVRWLRSLHHVLYLEGARGGYSFFKALLVTLRDFNRSVVISPDAAQKYADNLYVDPAVLAKIAMKANVPVIPVVLHWEKHPQAKGRAIGKCDALIAKRIFISPRANEFRDIFFKRRGARKFEKLPKEGFVEIGNRIFSKLKTLNQAYGPNLPQEMGARVS